MVFVNEPVKVERYSNGTHSEFLQPKRTIVAEWDLVCNNDWQSSLTNSMYFVGWLVGCAAVGQFADMFGRKKIFWSSIMFTNICSLGCACIPWFHGYVILRCLAGFGAGGAATVNFVLGVEFFPLYSRSLVGCLYNSAFGVGVVCMIPFAYYIESWRILSVVVTIPGFLIFLAYPFIYESPR